jgi:pathogenesis-related protein 1
VRASGPVFASILITAILIPLSLNGESGRSDPRIIISWAESRAASGRIDLTDDPGPADFASDQPNGRSIGSRLNALEVRQVLASHNRARAEVGIPPLQWSDVLAAYAQEWADHLASTSRRMEHRPHSGRWKQEHGENLFMGTDGYYDVADAVITWEREKFAYDGRAIDQSNVHACGHYTQLIWRNTKRIGCAKVRCAGNVIVVCNYDPPGNVLGQTPF